MKKVTNRPINSHFVFLMRSGILANSLRGHIHIHLTTQNFNLTLWVSGWIKIDVMVKLHVYVFQTKRQSERYLSSHHHISQKSSFVSYHFSYLAMLFSNFYHTLPILEGRGEGKGEKPQILNILYQIICVFLRYFTLDVMLGGWVEHIRGHSHIDIGFR